MKIGLAGLGLMGAAIARRLIDTGHLITVYNRHSIKTGPFANRGVAVASTPKELAQDSDFILISVTNFIAVKEICFGICGSRKAFEKVAPIIKHISKEMFY